MLAFFYRQPLKSWIHPDMIIMRLYTIICYSNYSGHSNCVSWHAAVTKIWGKVTFHCTWDSSSFSLLLSNKLLDSEVAKKNPNYFNIFNLNAQYKGLGALWCSVSSHYYTWNIILDLNNNKADFPISHVLWYTYLMICQSTVWVRGELWQGAKEWLRQPGRPH